MVAVTGKLDFTAEVVPIEGTAGDYLSFAVVVDEWANLTNPVLTAQIRDSDGNNPEDFTFVPDLTGGVLYVLPEQTRRLFELEDPGTYVLVGKHGGKVWTGKYDIQLSHDTSVARTLIKGSVELEEDVTA